MKYRVKFTRKGKRLTTNKYFNKKKNADAYKDALNKNLRGANARTVKFKRK